MMNKDRLQTYVFECCQDKISGGLKDKPGKAVDIYHTMYSLAGIAVSTQNESYYPLNTYNFENYFFEEIDPVYSIPRLKANKFILFFNETK